MPIDFAKYGGKDPSPKSKDSGIKLDFSKYQEPDQPSFVDKMQSGALPNMDIRQSPLMKQVQQSDQQQPSEQPQSDNRNGVEKTLDYIFKENPVSRALNYIPAKIAEYAVPDAPMINQNGIIPGTNARQQFANENPVLSSGNATFDKIGDVAGQFIGPMVGTMGTGAGALTSGAENVLAKYGAKFGNSLGGKVAKSAAEGALVGAPLNAAATLSTSDPTLGQVGEGAALGAGLGAGLGALGKYAGTKIGQALENWRANRNPQAEQQVSELLALPKAKSAQEIAQLPLNERLQYTDDLKFTNQGPLALPQGNYTQPTRLKVASGNQTLDYVMNQIKPEVESAIAVPTRRDQLITYIQDHLQVPREEIHNMPHTDLQDLGQMVRENISVYDKAVQAASKRGYDLPSLLEGEAPKLSQQVTRNAQERVAGVFPQDAPTIARPQSFNRSTVAGASMPRERVGLRDPQVTATPPIRKFAPVEHPKGMPIAKNTDWITKAKRDAHNYDLNAVLGSNQDLNIMKSNLPLEIGQKYDAHGLAKGLGNDIDNLYTLLKNGIDKNKPFHSGRLSDEGHQSPFTNGSFIVTSGPGKMLKKNGIKNVIVNDAYYHAIPDLQKEFPNVKFIRADEAPRYLKQEPVQTIAKPVLAQQPIKTNPNELKFAQTVRESATTSPEAAQRLTETPLMGNRTTNAADMERAQNIITKKGIHGATQDLMSARKIGPVENMMAQQLMHHYQSIGDIDSFLNILNKTAKDNRFMGQAIQALSTWNKLDAEGAALLANKVANRGKTAAESVDLTATQLKPVIAATDRIKQVSETKSLADEVMKIAANKQAGETLTEGEKATIKQFQDQVNKVNQGIKPFLPKEKGAKANATIKEVSQIEPKARTRDQVVSFLDAKAEQARQRLAASRNIGFAAVNKGNAVADYAIIGASHIANGVVKLSDFTEQMVKDFGESVKPHINEVFNKATNIFRKENGLPTVQELDKAVTGAVKKGTFTEDEAHQFKAWAAEIGHMSDEFKLEATQDLQKAMNEIGTSTFGQKASTVQTSMQLLSVPTAERNVIGNEAFNILQKINKMAAVPIDTAISKLTGDRTIVFKTGNQESYWKNFAQGAKSGWKGVSPNGQFASLDIHPEAFKSSLNPFKYLQKATGSLLQSFDHAAYMRAYGETLGTYAKLTGKEISELDQTIHELADHAGQYATFQDDTFLSKIATGAKRLLNKPTDMLADALVNKGVLPEKLSWKGIGTGDLVLKYAKTPANIIMRGIDFSPIGLMRGLGELAPLVFKREAFNQQKAVMALSRGITGTIGLTGLGYALASTGVLTGPSSSDADIRSLDTMTGKGEYKVNWSALERYIAGGLDKNDAQWQKGDRIFDWGWLQPMAISIAMGVNAQQSVAKQKVDGTKSYVGVAKDALVGSLKTIMQQPLLQGVQNLVSGVTNVAKYGSWTGIANIFKGAPASFVPALSNQARNFTDNTSRNTYDPNVWKEALNMVINRIPGLDKQLPIAYDTLGNAKEQIQGGQSGTLPQGLKSFASPVKMTTYTVSPEAKMIIDLINSSGDTKTAPRSPNKYLMVDKKKIELTSDQYSQIQQQTGLETQKQLAHLSPMLANPKIKDENKVKEVMSVLDKVGQKVRNDLNKQYPEFKPVKTTH